MNSTTNTRRPTPCFATFSRSTTPAKPERRANSGVTSASEISNTFVTTTWPGESGYFPPTFTRGPCQRRTVHVISPFRIRSRNEARNCTARSGLLFWFVMMRDGPRVERLRLEQREAVDTHALENSRSGSDGDRIDEYTDLVY